MVRAAALPASPSFRLDGKRALVTGAGRGIGLGCAAALAEAGASVVLCARSREEIENGAAAIRARGGVAEALPLDVNDLDAVSCALQGPYDILVNNAGTNRPKVFTEVTSEDYDAVLNLNVRAAFFVAQAVARGMIQAARRGSIIHMSSQMGHVGGPSRTLYCASKWAIEGLNKSMALDLAPYGIRVNTICPTFIETQMSKPFFENKAFLDSVLAKIKLGRLGRIEDVLGAVVFLASEASSLMTGSSMLLDGGWTAD